MKLENQVCTLEQAKKIKELGVCCHSLFVHDPERVINGSAGPVIFYNDEVDSVYAGLPCAFTASELGYMLIVGDDTHFIHTTYNEHSGVWESWAMVRDEDHPCGMKGVFNEEGESEAEAKAELLITLLENKIVSPEDCMESLGDA